jgi:predicted GNAT family acetyltransferase
MILDRPVWDSLTTRHADFAVGGALARRFAADISALAGTRDDEPESLAALAELVPADGTVLLIQADPIVLPPALRVDSSGPVVQMVLERLADVGDDPRIAPLTAGDVPEMLALATLTKPGPFATRTAALGGFFGIKDEGVLVAMAGQRLAHAGFTEVSGVCTHPDVRGRGLARVLSAHVARRILARGETPYLHANATNTPAIQLYESLGFRLRHTMHVAALARI